MVIPAPKRSKPGARWQIGSPVRILVPTEGHIGHRGNRELQPTPSIVSNTLVLRASQGDVEAREQILRDFRPLLRLVAGRHLRQSFTQRFDASDVVQQTCLAVQQSFDTFRGTCSAELHAWLERILRRTVHRLHQVHSAEKRDVGRERAGLNSEPTLSFVWTSASTQQPGPISAVIAGERALQVASALAQVPARYRAIIEQRFVDGMTLRDIAQAEKTTVGTVAGLLRRGLEYLQRYLPPEVRRELGIPGDGS